MWRKICGIQLFIQYRSQIHWIFDILRSWILCCHCWLNLGTQFWNYIQRINFHLFNRSLKILKQLLTINGKLWCFWYRTMAKNTWIAFWNERSGLCIEHFASHHAYSRLLYWSGSILSNQYLRKEVKRYRLKSFRQVEVSCQGYCKTENQRAKVKPTLCWGERLSPNMSRNSD